MGAEAKCAAVISGRIARGVARLETTTLEFRAPAIREVWPLADVTRVAVKSERLVVCAGRRAIELELGAKMAAKWADRILHPPTRANKLGLKPEWRVLLSGAVDKEFAGELKSSVAESGRTAKRDRDAIFLFVKAASDLEQITALKESLGTDGAFWLVRPKGNSAVTENAVMHAGRAAGLVDVKVVAFSETLSALKFVIPRSARAKV